MFLPPKKTIVFQAILVLAVMIGSTDAQQSNFDRRLAAMQQARTRGAQPQQPLRVASGDTGMDYQAPPAPTDRAAPRVASAPRRVLSQSNQTSGTRRISNATAQRASQPTTQVRQAVANGTQRRVRQASTNQVRSYLPQHLRTAQLSNGVMLDGGAPIMSPAPVISGPIVSGQVIDGGIIDGGVVSGGMVSGGCSSCDSGCDSCGVTVGESYFSDECCDRGGCPPGPCWLERLGPIIAGGEFFAGATSFRSTLFPNLDGSGGFANDCSYGFYEGFNFGLPLCRLSCGLFSGQIGIRATQTNFDGNDFTLEQREQLFVTAGFYRRVDYGLQGGIVWDFLREEWFAETDVAQVRAELAWAFPNGGSLGARYATNVSDDLASGVFNGTNFSNVLFSTEDNYRFFYRHESELGGYGDFFVGYTGSDQTVVGLDMDVSLGERVAMQSGFTYYLNDEAPTGTTGGSAGEAYNIYVGLAFRPRGRRFYRSYDRPLFSVADNGSMLMTRQQ